VTFYLFVKPEQRRQGIGRRLYDDLLQSAPGNARKPCASASGTTARNTGNLPRALGFTELRHHFMMALDLDAFDDTPYETIITKLKWKGSSLPPWKRWGTRKRSASCIS
jgi:GNAT superfamily N-acetyltransferase